MSFIPLTPVDPAAVLGNLRVGWTRGLHAGEKFMDVVLDTTSDLAHQSVVCVNAGLISGLELQQSLIGANTFRDVWKSIAEHGDRLHDVYFNYLHECFSSRHRAFDRLSGEESHVAG